MSIYDNQLTSAERRALKKHTHDLADEIDLARTLINREPGDTGDIETICKAMQTISKLALAHERLAVKAITSTLTQAVASGWLDQDTARAWVNHLYSRHPSSRVP